MRAFALTHQGLFIKRPLIADVTSCSKQCKVLSAAQAVQGDFAALGPPDSVHYDEIWCGPCVQSSRCFYCSIHCSLVPCCAFTPTDCAASGRY